MEEMIKDRIVIGLSVIVVPFWVAYSYSTISSVVVLSAIQEFGRMIPLITGIIGFMIMVNPYNKQREK